MPGHQISTPSWKCGLQFETSFWLRSKNLANRKNRYNREPDFGVPTVTSFYRSGRYLLSVAFWESEIIEGGEMNILIVDDQPEYRLLLRGVLMDQGWEVFTADDGEDGLSVMARVQMDLIVSDIYMPVMDGFKFHQAVREIPRYEKLPFIFVSAYDDEYTTRAVKDPRYETFLQKMSSIDELVEWVRYFLLPEEKRQNQPPGGESRLEPAAIAR